MQQLRIVIADRRPLVLRGLANVLESEADFEVIAQCDRGDACMRAVRDLRPHLALVDASLPRLSGVEITRTARVERLDTRILLLVGRTTREEASACAGPDGVIANDAPLDKFISQLRRLAASRASDRNARCAQSGEALAQLAQCPSTFTLDALTERERQVMRLVSAGLSNKEVGRRLQVSNGTVKVHLHNIYQKLSIANRTALAATIYHAGSAMTDLGKLLDHLF